MNGGDLSPDRVEAGRKRTRRTFGAVGIVVGMLSVFGGIVIYVAGPHISAVGLGLGGISVALAGLALRLGYR
jgi:hypothetical protein